ncbi:MAG: XF1762 family protein [Betaproteobacteria bacterium]
MFIAPISLRQARDFVALHHRHNAPPGGWKFGVGLFAPHLVGVGVAGRPIARVLDDGFTLEITRTCTDGTPNANSMIYGALWRAAKAMGYVRCVTYTQHDESGASLRGAGWLKTADLKPHAGWDRPNRKRQDTGSAGVARCRWEIRASHWIFT